MIVTLIGIGSDSLLQLFEGAQISYVRRLPQPGEDITGGQVLEMVDFSVPELAGTLVEWLNGQPSRKVTVTRSDDTTWHAEGKNVAEVEKLLKGAKAILALELSISNTAFADL